MNQVTNTNYKSYKETKTKAMDEKQVIILKLVDLLNQLIEVEKNQQVPEVKHTQHVDMLTIKECTEEFSGLSEHTVRQLVAQKKIAYIRTGQGKRGKILVNKDTLIAYLNGAA